MPARPEADDAVDLIWWAGAPQGAKDPGPQCCDDLVLLDPFLFPSLEAIIPMLGSGKSMQERRMQALPKGCQAGITSGT